VEDAVHGNLYGTVVGVDGSGVVRAAGWAERLSGSEQGFDGFVAKHHEDVFLSGTDKRIRQSSAAFSAQREWQRQSSPKPLPHQIPIDGQPLAVSRRFLLRRLSDAGLLPGWLMPSGGS
jgi:hypothetical protein